MNAKQVDQFEQVHIQLQSLYKETSLLSKTKPNDAINKFKLNRINSVLVSANEVLSEKYRPFTDFNQFDDEEIPTNSDVVFMLSQYLNSLEKLRADNIRQSVGNWYWVIDGKESSVRTAPPQKISNK
jgi:CMP-N-acetylneuraminic acid synthetase